jgi:activator of Hsp90 ATPase-like protein
MAGLQEFDKGRYRDGFSSERFLYSENAHHRGRTSFDYGKCEEIIEPEKIAYHIDFGPTITRVVVEFIAQGNQTKMLLTQEGFPDANLCKIVSRGTMEGLDELDQLLAGKTV